MLPVQGDFWSFIRHLNFRSEGRNHAEALIIQKVVNHSCLDAFLDGVTNQSTLHNIIILVILTYLCYIIDKTNSIILLLK